VSDPTLTRVPEAVAELVSVFQTALPGVAVDDWPSYGEAPREWLGVGLADNPGTPGYESQIDVQDGLGVTRYVEDILVRCVLHVESGKTDAVSELRTSAAGYLSLLDTALRAAQVTAGVWDRARLTGGMRWYPIPNNNGTVVEVAFTVTGTVLA
jgi:hypothetical protein